MPNGGSDCCGTCWFNRKNRGERDWPKHVDNTLPDHCEIRDLAIEDPFYTYCANHPHRRPERDRIPIGPVTRHGGWQEDPPYAEYPRYVRKPSPDTEEVRQHLLSPLDSLFGSPNLLNCQIIDAIPRARDPDRTESEYHWKKVYKISLISRNT